MNSHEVWQVEVQGHIYEANIEEIIEWIGEGSVLPEDKIRKGSLRWLKAEKVPELFGHFNGSHFETSAATNLTDASSLPEILKPEPKELEMTQSFLPETVKEPQVSADTFRREKVSDNVERQLAETQTISTNACSVHPELEARYFCGTCLTLFCKICPESFGGNVKICIDCGAMCRIYAGEESLVNSVGAINKSYPRSEFEQNNSGDPTKEDFGLVYFGRALIYPFKFKTSLVLGAAMFMLFTLGESVSAFGISMYFAAVVCFMLANTPTFGCLANTVENFSQGKTDKNFMPGFDEFALWDDVIHPFFLSLAVYSISFGLLIILISGAFWNASDSENKIESDKQKILSIVLPGAREDSNSEAQVSGINQFSDQLKRDENGQNKNIPVEDDIAQLQQNSAKEATGLRNLKQSTQQSLQSLRMKQMAADEETQDLGLTFGTLMRLSLVFSVPMFLALIWGILYFPAACAVAGYTRSFTAILNPSVVFDTIRRLGWDYAKILAMFLILVASAFGLNALLQTLIAPLNLPVLGNLPAKAIMSLFIFYLSIVFSITVGFALLKNSAKLNFRHN